MHHFKSYLLHIKGEILTISGVSVLSIPNLEDVSHIIEVCKDGVLLLVAVVALIRAINKYKKEK